MNKKALFEHLSGIIKEKISRLQSDIADLQKGIAEDSKSSAGDKFETSREMAQQELGKLSTQLNEQQRLKSLIDNQSADKSTQVQLGAIVETNKGLFLIGIPIGNSSFQGKEVIGIGLGAPLGQLLLNKKKSDQVSFNNQQFNIEEIY
ncbi:MAG: hypothetical protein K0S23_3077 [Fluviicola sp.]|jgi:transcription elongation GreA/GreB family factor|uniref:hypothetical protein n=1 Tax=Fluviicola sp. TaxID=1917219 RepID=UPI002611AB8C|nr:hypothetical protein [Fluviicola sp.]MDF3028770.1 hypothetical protein [Fluviicola sp.]